MFDLFRSRDKVVRIFLGGLLVVVAFSMLIYLIPGAGMSTGSSSNGDDIVAEIGKDTLTTRDVQQLIQQRMQGQRVPPDMLQFFAPQLIDQAIADRAIAYEAQRMGFVVTDADVAYAIRSIPNLGTLPPDQYRNAIESMGMSVPEFESNLRKKLYDLRLQDAALSGIVVTPKEVEQEFARRNEKLKLEYIAFDPNKIKAEVKPTDEQLKAYFGRVTNAFVTPETRTFGLVVVDPDRVAASMEVTDAQLQQYYDSHKDQFRTPERVRVRHILLMTQGKPKEQVDKIKLQAEDLLKQIKAGANFAELAKKYSEDPGSKANGGDLGWVVRGQTVKNFENTAFSLKPGEMSNVITTEYGFHIIQVMEKQDARLQPFDEVKNQIATDIKKNSVNDRVQNLADQARAEIAKAPQNAAQIAQQLGLSYAQADNLKNGDPMPIIGVDKQTDEQVFSMAKGEVSPVTQAGNRLVVVVLSDVHKPHPATFAEVESQVRARFVNDEANKIVADRSKQAADMLKSNGGDLQAVAKKFGLEVKTSDFFTRQGAAEGIGSASYFVDYFSKPVGSIIGAVNVGPQTVVCKIAAKEAADPSKLAGERDSILAQLKTKKQDERDALFQDSIMTKLTEEHKIKIHKDVINRIIQGYRG